VTRVRGLAAADPETLAGTVDVPVGNATRWVARARDLLVDLRPLGEPNPTDALLPAATGRYLWVKLTLVGNEYATPAVGAVRTYFPRQSYLRHLPAVYREDAASAAFLERFLSPFESLFTDVEDDIGRVTRYMDPEGVPGDALAWLGDWLGVDLDETWPEPARRELLARAPELAAKRGTRDGLLAVVRTYLRHTRPRSPWREALETDAEALVDAVRERPLTDAETRAALGDHDDLRSLSGEPALRHMVVAWSRVLDRRRALLDATVAAGALAAEDREEYGTPVSLIHESDEGSLRYLVEYATVLEELAETVERDATPTPDVAATLETYERLVRDAAVRSGPLLLEGPDLDCIDDEDVLARYAALVEHERGFAVLAGPGVEGDRLRTVRRVVEAEQPAHAAGSAVGLRPWIRLGSHSYLGVNTGLPKRELVLERARLGVDSVLDTREPFAQLDVRSRLGRDSFMS
jgi:phage tail-like protein